MRTSGLNASVLKENPAAGGKTSADVQEQDKRLLQKSGNESVQKVKGDKDVSRHRTESFLGKRPNSKWNFTVQIYSIRGEA